MQGGRGVKIVIFMALRCKVMENTRKTEGAWGKSFSGPPRGPEEQRTYEQRTRLPTTRSALPPWHGSSNISNEFVQRGTRPVSTFRD